MDKKKAKFSVLWVMYESTLASSIEGLRKGESTELREPLEGYRLRVWYMEGGNLKSHIYQKGELDDRAMGESWIPVAKKVRHDR
ncbi:unnamed protein product [marine sediment metagenome]|uniref:Uncharacterized protein n=1 Tax=marine sediment metagenome TaxID=412755 RepID=X1UWP1_9ZZZZ